jgi:predicted metalloprotease with PDZ domain
LYRHDVLEKPSTLQLFVPENYQIACARPQTEKHKIYANSIHELFDSPLIASANLRHHSFEVQAHTFHLWAQGGEMLDVEKIATDFQKFASLQIADFGVFPSTAYHFLLQISQQKAYHGVEHTDSTVIHLGPSTDVMQSLYKELLGICSHELYHVWNIKTLRPKAMLPYNYKAENYTDLTAIAEGITTYLGDWYLYKSGLITLQEFQNELAEHVQKHFDQGAYLYNSLGESAWDTWLDGYTIGAPQRKLSIYSDGALFAFICDARIRKHSANSKTLCDAMRSAAGFVFAYPAVYTRRTAADPSATSVLRREVGTEARGSRLNAYRASAARLAFLELDILLPKHPLLFNHDHQRYPVLELHGAEPSHAIDAHDFSRNVNAYATAEHHHAG